MSWIADLKTIIDQMPEALPPARVGRGWRRISDEPFIRRKVQRQRGQIYWYWIAAPHGRKQRYFPYTVDGFQQAIAYRDAYESASA